MADLARVQQELGEAIGAVLTRHGLMANRTLVISELFHEDGQRTLETFAPDDLREWDYLGMLGTVLARQKAAILADAVLDDGEDEDDDGEAAGASG